MSLETWEEDLPALAEGISEVLVEECDPRSVHTFFDGENDLDKALWARAAELGFLGIGLSEEFGGLGFGARGLDVLYRTLGRAMAPGAFVPTLAAAQWLEQVGPEDLSASLLPEVVAGERTFAVPFALDGEGGALNDGRLGGTTPLMLTSRDATTAVLSVKREGAAAFALVDLAGVGFVANDIWDHTRLVGRYTLDNAEPLAVIDDVDGTAAATLRSNVALGIAGDCVGGARAIADQTIEYLKQREQFGRLLASMQALKHRCAELMRAVLEGEQALDQGVEATALGNPAAHMWASLAKALAAEKFFFVADDCLQLHGGVGFTWEFDAHIFLKRALLNRELSGNNAFHRDLAARHLAEADLAGVSTAELTT